MNGIAGYLQILVLNFKLYGIVCTLQNPRCKRNFLDHTPQQLLLDIDETLQIWHNYLQRGDRELHQFFKCIQTKKTVKVRSFGFIW